MSFAENKNFLMYLRGRQIAGLLYNQNMSDSISEAFVPLTGLGNPLDFDFDSEGGLIYWLQATGVITLDFDFDSEGGLIYWLQATGVIIDSSTVPVT